MNKASKKKYWYAKRLETLFFNQMITNPQTQKKITTLLRRVAKLAYKDGLDWKPRTPKPTSTPNLPASCECEDNVCKNGTSCKPMQDKPKVCKHKWVKDPIGYAMPEFKCTDCNMRSYKPAPDSVELPEEIKDLISKAHQAGRKEAVEEILPRVYKLRAMIPLTYGVRAREEAKKLIDDLSKLKQK